MLRMNDQISILPNEKKTSASRQEYGCYTVDDLTQILGVGHKAIYALIHKKAFPAIRIAALAIVFPKIRSSLGCTSNKGFKLQSPPVTASNFCERCAIIFISILKGVGAP